MKTLTLALLLATATPVMAAPQPIPSTAATIAQQDQQLNAKRQHEFLSQKQHQQQLLRQSEQRVAAAEKRQRQLKATFAANEKQLTKLSEQLRQRSGELGQVFDVLKGEGEQFQQTMQQSLVSAEVPVDQTAFTWIHEDSIPTAKDLQSLQQQLAIQLTQSGAISHFERDVTTPAGDSQSQQVIRVGEFELFNQDGQFLNWQSDTQSLQVLSKQPGSASDYAQGDSDEVLLDPTRGQLLNLAGQLPNVWQRVAQGGVIGYVIIALGILGLAIALFRLYQLLVDERKVTSQLKTEQPSEDNPLGRVLANVPKDEHQMEELELLVDEAVSQELPRLERSHTLVKLFAGVTPLLGLLGTVTGMIATFQSITLFGTGDPKMMASGISQALMTTVLGLVAAIPLLFAHNLLTTRARRISQILQQQTLSLLADRVKQESK